MTNDTYEKLRHWCMKNAPGVSGGGGNEGLRLLATLLDEHAEAVSHASALGRAEGFARAREMAATLVKERSTSVMIGDMLADGIRAMQDDGAGAGERGRRVSNGVATKGFKHHCERCGTWEDIGDTEEEARAWVARRHAADATRAEGEAAAYPRCVKCGESETRHDSTGWRKRWEGGPDWVIVCNGFQTAGDTPETSRETRTETGDTFRMNIYSRGGNLWDRIGGTEEELREQGVGFTTAKGQKEWVCHLDRNGTTVAVCRRGEWKDVK